ncbi:hypothetical protein NQZ68_017386 [Dissostichus eleginoides]|nr:hypothetical protein NQZ68_017386 [Dissostichus eleginoides]
MKATLTIPSWASGSGRDRMSEAQAHNATHLGDQQRKTNASGHREGISGAAQAVYVLDRVCDVLSAEWYKSCEYFDLSRFSKHFRQEFLCSGDPAMRQLCNRMCAHGKNGVCVSRPPLYCSRSRSDPSPRRRRTV